MKVYAVVRVRFKGRDTQASIQNMKVFANYADAEKLLNTPEYLRSFHTIEEWEIS